MPLSAYFMNGSRNLFLVLCGVAIARVAGGAELDPLQRLTSPDVEIRRAAAESLGQQNAPTDNAASALIAALKDSDVRVRANAAWALGKLKHQLDRTTPALIESLNDEDWTVRHNAALSLTWIGASTVPALTKALGDTRPFVRLYAASALQQLEPAKPEAIVPVLTQLLGERDDLRATAAQILAAIGEPATVAVPQLIEMLDSKNRVVRGNAVACLGAIGPAAKAAVGPLAKLTAAGNKSDDRIYAARALVRIGDKPDTWVPGLIAMLQPTHEESVPAAAVNSLAAIGAPALPFLIEALANAEPIVRGFAADSLAIMGPGAASAIPALAKAAQDSDSDVRHRAVKALGSIDGSDAAVVALLNSALADPHELVRMTAQEALAKQGSSAPSANYPAR